MFASLSDILNYVFGINFPLPIQTFGLFVAFSFLVAYYLIAAELKRKEALGLIAPIQKKTIVGKKASIIDYAYQIVFGFIIGYKLSFLIFNYDAFVDNPPGIILSMEGNFIGGLAGAIILLYFFYQEQKKISGPEKVVVVTVHPYQLMGTITLYAAVAGMIGAKLFHNLENFGEFMLDPVGSLLSFSGLTFYGGLICGAAAVLYVAHKNGIKAIHMVDAAGPGLMMAYATGRLGCQLSGDGDWGIVNTNPKPDWMSFLPDWMWSFKYPHNVISEGIPIPGCEGKHCFELAQGVFPTPFYETIMCLLLFAFLWSIRKKITIPGLLFSIYLILNGIERFLIESIRVNTHYSVNGFQFTQAQLISTILILSGSIWAFVLIINHKKSIQNG